MMSYWVYENYRHNKAVVHKAECRFCKDGAGLHEVGENTNGQWHGPFCDASEAQAKARNTGRANVWNCNACALRK